MADKESLFDKIRESRRAMLVQLDEIDRQRKIYPLWTIREILAHISGWDDAIIASIQAHLNNEPIGSFAARGVDAYNASTITSREGLSYDHIYREYLVTRDQLLEVFQTVPPERLGDTMILPWGDTGTMEELISGFSEHEFEHAQDIENIIREAKKS